MTVDDPMDGSDYWRRLLRAVSHLIVPCLSLAVFLGACEEVTNVRIIAPSSLAGGTVTVDGEPWGELQADGQTATNSVAVAPYMRHRIVIRKPGYRPIVRDVMYRGYGGQQLMIASTELQQERRHP